MILMSSFCLEFLVIGGLLSKYITSPDPLFISGLARPFSKLTPKDITLLPVGLVLIPLKFWFTDAENPLVGAIILLALDSNARTFDSVVTPT